MPTVKVIKWLGGEATANQLDLIVLGMINIKKSNLNEGFRQTQFARSYLNKMGIIQIGEKKGKWKLNPDYVNMSDEEIEKIIKKKYRERYKR